ncbi:hypothetical protein G4G28_13385 [Massilia sp. Dwa41.01b]|uniref:hypothetical protein n=1 Tax=Massilia sp. Dwa41.01b TaxID=2709302 RepID=UPI001600F9E4|nr:hypothetical protein [Massilia sp. Dwa41.01b]QNA89210.1 hypothetical protein G4G28_13385 [Massilia sp. Dwa41.01b]
MRGPLSAFGPARDRWNAPLPTVIPRLDLAPAPATPRFAIVRNGLAIRESDGLAPGGAEGFQVRWSGVLIVEHGGSYTFFAGAPRPDCEAPGDEACDHARWRINLRRGQKTWLLLNRRWDGENAPDRASGPLHLRRGAYFIDIDFHEETPEFDEPLELGRAATGFTVKYSGPDTGDRIAALPQERLYRDVVMAPLDSRAALAPAARAYFANQYPGSLRDIRRTYQRAFKALLLCHRLRLSATLGPRAAVSETGYLLSAPALFAGTTYVAGTPYSSHRAWFDLNLLPVGDAYNGDPERQPPAPLDARDTLGFTPPGPVRLVRAPA